MRERAHEPSTRARSQMRRMVGVATLLFWASAALMTVLVVLFWVAPGLRVERSLNLLGGIFVGLAMVSSGLLFLQ
jgi:cell division septal protein FtsQ